MQYLYSAISIDQYSIKIKHAYIGIYSDIMKYRYRVIQLPNL